MTPLKLECFLPDESISGGEGTMSTLPVFNLFPKIQTVNIFTGCNIDFHIVKLRYEFIDSGRHSIVLGNNV